MGERERQTEREREREKRRGGCEHMKYEAPAESRWRVQGGRVEGWRGAGGRRRRAGDSALSHPDDPCLVRGSRADL